MWRFVAGIAIWIALGHAPVLAVADRPIRPPAACPDDLQTLTSLLLRDLPSYANRVTQRTFLSFDTTTASSDRSTQRNRPGYVLLAGHPEFEPLSLGPGEYVSTPDVEAATQQVFFSTLERQYVNDRPINLQHYHWVILAQDADAWWLVTMRSQIGILPANQPPTPPEDTTQGAIGQAIRLWLRDCRNGSIYAQTGSQSSQ